MVFRIKCNSCFPDGKGTCNPNFTNRRIVKNYPSWKCAKCGYTMFSEVARSVINYTWDSSSTGEYDDRVAIALREG